jgi:hypothetical protein
MPGKTLVFCIGVVVTLLVVGQDVGAALLRDTRQDRPLGPRLELGVHGRKRHSHVLG